MRTRNHSFFLIITIYIVGLLWAPLGCGDPSHRSPSRRDSSRGDSTSGQDRLSGNHSSSPVEGRRVGRRPSPNGNGDIQMTGFKSKPKLSRNVTTREVYLVVEFQSREEGKKELFTNQVALKGYLNNDGNAVLTDTDPAANGKHRLKGVAICSDLESCDQAVVTVYYLVNGEKRQVQYDFNFAPIVVKEIEVPTFTEEVVVDHGKTNVNDPNDEMSGKEGQYVGVEPEKLQPGFFGDLEDYKKELDPEVARRAKLLEQQKNLVIPLPPRAKPPQQSQQELPPPAPVRPSSENKQDSTEAVPVTPTESQPGVTEGQASSPSPVSEPESGFTPADTDDVDFPYIIPLNTSVGGRAMYSPFINKKGQPGKIENASAVRSSSDCYRKHNSHSNYGAGVTIDLIEDTCALFQAMYPGNIIELTAISIAKGGPFGKHAGHQNGMDVDILYIDGNNRSAVQGNKVASWFNYQKNADYMKLWVKTGQVGRIFVNSVVKKGFCQWVKNNKNRDPMDLELLHRMIPWTGHSSHFHVRLNCPKTEHYKLCENQDPPEPGTGCNKHGISL